MNPVELWALWMKGWLKAADALIDMQGRYMRLRGPAPVGAAQGEVERTKARVREMTETLARMQRDLALAGAPPEANRQASETAPQRKTKRRGAGTGATQRSRSRQAR